jgi:ABC-2 type transport system permease protein
MSKERDPKERNTRLENLGLLGGMVALILLTVLLNGFISKPHELATHDNQHALLSAGTSAALFAALIGVMAVTSEFRHGTIRPTFVVTPHRSRVIAAKLTASLLMGVVFGLVAVALSFGVGRAILSVRGIPLELGTSHVLWLVLGTPVITAAWAADRRRPRHGSPKPGSGRDRTDRLGDGHRQPPARLVARRNVT